MVEVTASCYGCKTKIDLGYKAPINDALLATQGTFLCTDCSDKLTHIIENK